MKAVLLGALTLGVLAGCGEGLVDTTRWEKRQAAIDPPRLWQVQVLDGAVPSEPVTVCADSIMLAGFLEPMPSFGGARCEPLDGRRSVGADRGLVCQADGRRYAVNSQRTGDPDSAFTVRFATRPLRGGPEYRQTRRYEHLGRCPEGWRVGAHTDQQGRRLSDARWWPGRRRMLAFLACTSACRRDANVRFWRKADVQAGAAAG